MKVVHVQNDGSQFQFLPAGVKEIKKGTLGITSIESPYLQLADGESEIAFQMADFSFRIIIKEGKPQGLYLMPNGAEHLRIPVTKPASEPPKVLENPDLDVMVYNALRASGKPLKTTQIARKICKTFGVDEQDKAQFKKFVDRLYHFITNEVSKSKIIKDGRLYNLPPDRRY